MAEQLKAALEEVEPLRKVTLEFLNWHPSRVDLLSVAMATGSAINVYS